MPYPLFATLLDSLGLALCLFDAEDRTVLWNPSFLRFFPEHEGKVHAGEPYSENLRRFYRVRLAPEEQPYLERYIADGIARHRHQSRPFVFLHRDRWLRMTSLPTPEGGRVRIWVEIPSPELPELGIPANPMLSQFSAGQTGLAVLENVVDGVMVLDRRGRISLVNDHFLQIYGLPDRQSVLGLSYQELLLALWSGSSSVGAAPDHHQPWEVALRDNSRFTGAPFGVPLPGDRWIRVAVHRAMDGTSYGIHVDITAMKRQQRELREAERRARESEARLLAVNDALCRWLGWSGGELLQRNFRRLVDRRDRQRLQRASSQVLNGERPVFQTECRFIHRDGTRLWGCAVVRPFPIPAMPGNC